MRISNSDKSKSNCVDKNDFLRALDSLKDQQKNNKSEITFFIDDAFYERAKSYLTAKENKTLSQDEIDISEMTKWEIQTIKWKKWTLNSSQQIVNGENKIVLSKSQLCENLIFAHSRVAHRGRQTTEHWIKQNFAEVNQKVINLFVA